MIISPKIRGFLCATAHPVGCAHHVAAQIDVIRARGAIANAPKRVLVIGASTGYGLASRITAAFGGGASTLGVFFERPAEDGKTASPGWYNSAAFEVAAKEAGIPAFSLNGDAFSDEMKRSAIDLIKREMGKVDCVIYSLASPRRAHPRTGEVCRSVLKPIGATFTNKNLNTNTGVVDEVTIEPADEEEIRQTIAVMGGEDWEMWMEALQEADVLDNGVTTLAYSYIGPELTWAVYKNGTIGRAKEDLERAQRAIDTRLAPLGGKAWVSVNKALVTQASSAIPVVPLYISLLYKIMKAEGSHEDCIEQIDRLFRDRLCPGNPMPDEVGRIRLDDWEMVESVQQLITKHWTNVSTENISEYGDLKGYQESFLRLFGFGLPDVDYTGETDPVVDIPSLV